MLGRATADACRAVVRSCEGILAGLSVGRCVARYPVRACTETYSLPPTPASMVAMRPGGPDGRTDDANGPIVIAQIMRASSPTRCEVAEQAWRDGDVLGAIDAADRALAAGTDSDGRAAGVAAAGAAADGALLDAAARWRGVGSALDGAAAARAAGRAALAAALAGDITAAVGDLADGPRPAAGPGTPGPDRPARRGRRRGRGGGRRAGQGVAAPRRPGGRERGPRPDGRRAARRAGRHLTAAGGDLEVARAMLRALPGEPTGRTRLLLRAWLDLRTGHLGAAREALTAAARTPVLRRDALLGAAVAVGLARRSGDAAATAATWARVAPVVAGTDVELLLLDVVGRAVGGRRAGLADRP